MLHSTLSVALLLSLSRATAATSSNCQNVAFTVSGTAQNRNLTGIPTTSLNALVAFFNSAPVITVTGPQVLAGTYCKPTIASPNNQKLEVMFPSITANRDSFSALGGLGDGFPEYEPDMYSWVKYANAKGYPTLALDRLGSGNSSHPDPLLVAQAPYEIVLYNDLAQQLRKGTNSQVPAYHYLIYVGNSYGSQLGTGVAGAFPTAYDEYLLTGYSKDVQQDFVGVDLTIPAPADTVDPARFGTLDPGYVTTSSETGRTNSFFGSKAQVAFSDTVADLFFKRKDVVSVGQFASIYAIVYDAPTFAGRVLVLTGEQDQAFCGPGSPVIGPAHCGTLLAETKSLFPKAQYNWKSVNETGHAIQVHYSAQTVFNIAHQFLGGASFQGGPPA